MLYKEGNINNHHILVVKKHYIPQESNFILYKRGNIMVVSLMGCYRRNVDIHERTSLRQKSHFKSYSLKQLTQLQLHGIVL